VKKATAVATIAFFFVFQKKKTTSSYSLVLLQLSSPSLCLKRRKTMAMWFYCNEKGDGTNLPSPSLVVVL
jgi:hypothetical protein